MCLSNTLVRVHNLLSTGQRCKMRMAHRDDPETGRGDGAAGHDQTSASTGVRGSASPSDASQSSPSREQGPEGSAVRSMGGPRSIETPGWLRDASAAGFAVRGAMASEIIPHSLWLGRGQFALEHELMAQAKISHVLTTANDTPEVQAAMEERVAQGTLCGYLCLDVGDFGTDDGISRVFENAFSFLDEAIQSGGVAFVHCANGSNRSPTIVTGYLKHRHPSWSIQRCLEEVLMVRPHIMPLKDNLAQLSLWSGDKIDPQAFHTLKTAAKKRWKNVNLA